MNHDTKEIIPETGSNSSCATFIIAVPNLITDAIATHLDEYKTPEVFIELADEKAMEAFVDDAAWESKFNTISQANTDNKVGGGIFIHPGMGTQSDRVSREAADRRVAAL